MITLQERIEEMLESQVIKWEIARRNYAALSKIEERVIPIGELNFRLSFNPARIISSAAAIDVKSIEQRLCFLCKKNREVGQASIPWHERYEILVNPFPIFHRHFVIAANTHIPQSIGGRIADLLSLAKELPNYVIFYNGAKCGASAPDHAHFQAGERSFLPLITETERLKQKYLQENGVTETALYHFLLPHAVWLIESDRFNKIIELFSKFYQKLQQMQDTQQEPLFNLLATYTDNCYQLYIIPRKIHRPWQYAATDEQHILISPASVDLGGVFITPRREDFDKITAADIIDILNQI